MNRDPSSSKIQEMRQRYERAGMHKADLADCPVAQFTAWFHEITEAGETLEPNAMTLATADDDGVPSARTVLLKGGLDHGAFWFFTNHTSKKGQDLAVNSRAGLVFLWKEWERQVCVRGVVERLQKAETQAYFESRPYESQIGAWTSRQSTEIPDRAHLEDRDLRLRRRFAEGNVPCPDFWGGYAVKPLSIEFWQGRPGRLHDRFRYHREGLDAPWACARLAP